MKRGVFLYASINCKFAQFVLYIENTHAKGFHPSVSKSF